MRKTNPHLFIRKKIRKLGKYRVGSLGRFSLDLVTFLLGKAHLKVAGLAAHPTLICPISRFANQRLLGNTQRPLIVLPRLRVRRAAPATGRRVRQRLGRPGAERLVIEVLFVRDERKENAILGVGPTGVAIHQLIGIDHEKARILELFPSDVALA